MTDGHSLNNILYLGITFIYKLYLDCPHVDMVLFSLFVCLSLCFSVFLCAKPRFQSYLYRFIFITIPINQAFCCHNIVEVCSRCQCFCHWSLSPPLPLLDNPRKFSPLVLHVLHFSFFFYNCLQVATVVSVVKLKSVCLVFQVNYICFCT